MDYWVYHCLNLKLRLRQYLSLLLSLSYHKHYKGTSDKDIRNDFTILYVRDPILLNRWYTMFAISKPITRLSLLLIFLFGPLCEEQGGRQNRPSSYADVVGKYREDFHIKVKKMFVGKLALTSNPWGRPKWVWLKLKLTRKGDFYEVSVTAFFANFSSCTALSDTWMSIFSHFPSKTPKVRLESTNDEHPRHFCVGVPPRKQITQSVPLDF